MDGSVILIYAPIDAAAARYPRPPLGLLYLGTVLQDQGIFPQLFDFQHQDTSWKGVEAAVARAERCLVGFYCDSENIFRVLNLSDRLLSRYPHVRIVLGGPHVAHVWEPYVTENRTVVRGEGEYPLLLLAKFYLADEGTLPDIPGIVYLQDGRLQANPISLGPYEDINHLPIPDYSLLPRKDSYYPVLMTARGCPYKCFFCSEGHGDHAYRPRSIQNVEQELLSLKVFFNDNLPYLSFADDVFTVSAQRVHDMCDIMDRHFPDKTRFGFFCEGRVNILAEYPELIKRLKCAGLLRLQIGIESGDQRMLDKLNKGFRVEQIEKVVAVAYQEQIPSIYGNFMCGLPGQTEKDIEKEITFAKHLVDLAPGRLEVSMTVLTPYPGTEYRINASRWGLTIVDHDFITGRMATDSSFIETSYLTRRQIEYLCEHFKSEVEAYSLEKAAVSLSSQEIKELFMLTAERSLPIVLVQKLSQLDHARWILHLRSRENHRFLFELPDHLRTAGSPLSVVSNKVVQFGETFLVNKYSAMEFELTQDEMQVYQYFSGKLNFGEIAQRVSSERSLTRDCALRKCMDVYLKCEDHLAAIVLL